MKFDVNVGFVEIEYGVRMVGDCIIENGEVTVGVTLIVGMTRIGFDPPEAAAAAAALLFLRPDAPAADDEADEEPAAVEVVVVDVVLVVDAAADDDPALAELLEAAPAPYPP